MGINGCSRIRHKPTPLEVGFVFFLVQKIFDKLKTAGLTERRRLNVAIDSNLVGFQFLDHP
jgi:hypothetical protein